MNCAKKNAIFLHCLPASRGQEVSAEVIDGKQSKVWQQALNRVYVQKSVLLYCLEKLW
jgi:ornithine carbamoyltransferase